ncbi:MAG: hypothetical protein DHS20C18_47600 [Saprospiraceae bacterium]|nr:MAG: hypothetical protein DHS20C18_47600 [Saprospiraceae bacterium]
MKKLDRLLIANFIPPFIMTFMIATFVLLMQFLWVYVDDIAGKGLGMFIIIELISYKCAGLIPMALPLAVLISSVMVLGAMAEHYELSSFKSAGVSLIRIMRPLILFGILSTIFSYFCSNYLIPVANLQFGSRMYDIQRQKPALRLDAGVFNDDFQGYAIHIKEKSPNGRNIKGVLLYDHSESSRGQLTEIIAEEGEMYSSDDGNYFVMNLKNGNQYVETRPTVGQRSDKSFPFIRTTFSNWTKVFDLSEFSLGRTDKRLFETHRSMLSSGQLRVAIDSLGIKVERRKKAISNHVANYFVILPVDSTFLEFEDETDSEQVADSVKLVPIDDSTASVNPVKINIPPSDEKSRQQAIQQAKREQRPEDIPLPDKTITNTSTYKKKSAPQKKITTQKDISIDSLETFESIVETFPIYEQKQLYAKAKSFARSIQSQSESAIRSLDRLKESEVKHIYELHTKYSMAAVCIIFVFIGAPMGAIVRKGGFGYPILVSIIFFMLFIVLTIFCRKIAETFVVPAALAGWIPCIVLFPIGLILTIKAMNDSKMVNTDRYRAFFAKIFKPKKDTLEEEV